jgi:hypothetical protein
MDQDEDSCSQEACSTSPLANDEIKQDGALATGIQASLFSPHESQVRYDTLSSKNNERLDEFATSPPRSGWSSLRSSSFAPVILPFPPHANTVDKDPDFFVGASLPGSGSGPHFITGKDKIKDQLLSALATTLITHIWQPEPPSRNKVRSPLVPFLVNEKKGL